MEREKMTIEQEIFYSLPTEYREKLRRYLMRFYKLTPLDFIKLLHSKHEDFELQYDFTLRLIKEGHEMHRDALKEFSHDRGWSFEATLLNIPTKVKQKEKSNE